MTAALTPVHRSRWRRRPSERDFAVGRVRPRRLVHFRSEIQLVRFGGKIRPQRLVRFGNEVRLLHEPANQPKPRKPLKQIRPMPRKPTRPATPARLDATHLQNQCRRLPDLVIRRLAQLLQVCHVFG